MNSSHDGEGCALTVGWIIGFEVEGLGTKGLMQYNGQQSQREFDDVAQHSAVCAGVRV